MNYTVCITIITLKDGVFSVDKCDRSKRQSPSGGHTWVLGVIGTFFFWQKSGFIKNNLSQLWLVCLLSRSPYFLWQIWVPCVNFSPPLDTRAHIKANVSGGSNHMERSSSNQSPWAAVSQRLWQTWNNTRYSVWQQSHKSNPTADGFDSVLLANTKVEAIIRNNQIAVSLLSRILSALLNSQRWTNSTLSHYSNYFIKPSLFLYIAPGVFSAHLSLTLIFFKTYCAVVSASRHMISPGIEKVFL